VCVPPKPIPKSEEVGSSIPISSPSFTAMGALLVEDCLKLTIGALTRGDRGRGRIFLRGVPIEFEVRTTFPHGVMHPIRFVRLKFNGRTQDIRIIEIPIFGDTRMKPYFDLGGRRSRTLLLAPGETVFRSREILGARYRSQCLWWPKWKRVQKKELQDRYWAELYLKGTSNNGRF
jgi:hypothetical protein